MRQKASLSLEDLHRCLEQKVACPSWGQSFLLGTGKLSPAKSLLDQGVIDGETLTLVLIKLGILTCSLDGSAKLWNASSGECLQTFTHGSLLKCRIFTAGGYRLLTCCVENSTAKLWDASTRRCIQTFNGLCNPSNDQSPTFSPDGLSVLTSSATGAKIFVPAGSASVHSQLFERASHLRCSPQVHQCF